MELSLRDEILLILDFEDILNVPDIIDFIGRFRGARKDKRVVDIQELEKVLYDMVEVHFLIEPWNLLFLQPGLRRKSRTIRVRELKREDIAGREPLKLLYRLTPRGWKWQRELLDERAKNNLWIPKKLKGQS